MIAKIYRPARTAMQSGDAKTQRWLLEYEPEMERRVDPLMGWTSSADMRSQVRLAFATRDEAVGYAERHGIPYRVFEPKESRAPVISYSDNFKYDRATPWTH
jgi:hypothetical protein